MEILPDNFNGFLITVLLLSLIIAIALSYIIIARYKKSVVKGMNYSSMQYKKPEIYQQEFINYTNPVTFEYHNQQKHKKSNLFNSIKSVQRKSFINYSLSCIFFCFFITLLYYYLSEFEFNAVRFMFVFIIFLFPLVFVSILFFAKNIKEEFTYLGFSMCFYFLAVLFSWIFFNPDGVSYFFFLFPVIIYNLLPFFFILLLRIKKIRSISLTVFLFCFISLFGANSILSFLIAREGALKTTSDFILNLGFRGLLHNFIYFSLLIFFSLIISWIILQLFRYTYKRNIITMLQLNTDSYILIFFLCYSLFLMSNKSYVIIFSFFVYKIVAYILFKINKPRESLNINLLYLRVFDLKKKTVSLFTGLESYWRFAGSAQLISGPDMATTTVEPDELISYLNGQLKKSFCDTENRIEENINGMSVNSNFDFTHNVNEFFCRENTWKDVLKKLVSKSEIVVMDLRSFSQKYRGCMYEIRQLVNLMPLGKCLFVVDKNTDIPFTKYAFEYSLYYLAVDSPNRNTDKCIINFYEMNNINKKSLADLMEALCFIRSNVSAS